MNRTTSSDEPVVARTPRHQRSFRRDALWALAIVVVLEVLTLWAETTPWWEHYSWPFHDLFMRTWRGQDINPDTARPLAFIDIDDDAFERWGTSGVTNRGRLRDLIRFAADGQASLIVVDLDLSHPDLTPSSGDKELTAWLRDYHAGPNLIFARALGPSPPLEHTTWVDQGSLIASVVEHNELIHFATAAFTMDADASVRRWRLWETLCEDARPVALPSVELLTVAIMDDPKDGARRLRGLLDATVRERCDQIGLGMARELHFAQFPDLQLFPDPHGEQIFYTQPWPVLNWVGHRLAYLPALTILDRKPSTDPVKGRIVVVGGSNAASRDFVQTPIGTMPGAMVLLNSINALLQEGQLRHPPWLLGIGVALGMGVWYILYVFQFPVALFVAAGFVFVVTWLVSWCLIRYGIWLDMAVPSFGMFFHRWLVVMETIVHDWKNYRWRAMLSQRFRGGPVIVVLLAGLTAAWSGTARADGPAVAGHVSAMDGDANATFTVERGGSRIAAQYWANVFDGDRIIVTGNGRLEIAPNGPVVTATNSPVVVKAVRPATAVQVFAERFGWILTQFSEQERKPQQLMSKGIRGPMAMALPLLGGSNHQRVVAGTRRLTVAWTGGTPPFKATIATAAGVVTLEPAANGEQRASALLRLGSGRYEVRVSDSQKATRSAQIEVVPAAPALDEAGIADAPVDVRFAMEAVQLARMDEGRWRLEAFDRLVDAQSDQRVARLLSARLAAGRSLDDPNK
jgi:CHASE2 domain-containing sensor protein